MSGSDSVTLKVGTDSTASRQTPRRTREANAALAKSWPTTRPTRRVRGVVAFSVGSAYLSREIINARYRVLKFTTAPQAIAICNSTNVWDSYMRCHYRLRHRPRAADESERSQRSLSKSAVAANAAADDRPTARDDSPTLIMSTYTRTYSYVVTSIQKSINLNKQLIT